MRPLTEIFARDSFQSQGLICKRTKAGKNLFNIRQIIWLDKEVQMDWGVKSGLAGEHLALNILDQLLPGEEYSLSVGCVSFATLSLYEQFYAELISTMTNEGGIITNNTINSWLKIHYQTDIYSI